MNNEEKIVIYSVIYLGLLIGYNRAHAVVLSWN